MTKVKKRWTDAELAILRAHYPDKTGADVAAMLGRKVSTVHQAAVRHGIKKSEAFIAGDMSARMQRGQQSERIKAAQFKPGFTPWNAGKKGWCPPGAARTQFKPGARMGAAAHNWVPVGSYRITSKDQTLQLKTSDDIGPSAQRWTPVARIVWEAAHGPIPAGMLVVFKPGYKTTVLEEIAIDRLDCITRAEHARRNHPRFNNPELGQLIQLKGAIARQVNRIIREHHDKSQHQ